MNLGPDVAELSWGSRSWCRSSTGGETLPMRTTNRTAILGWAQEFQNNFELRLNNTNMPVIKCSKNTKSVKKPYCKYEKFKVNHARTSRYQKSSIIYMQKLLNTDSERQKKITRSMNAACSREERLQNSSLSL